MESSTWLILLIEDDEEDYFLTRSMFKEVTKHTVDLKWAQNSRDALQMLTQIQPDVVLVDYQLGPENGLELVRKAVMQGYRMPFILLTGQGSYDVDMEAMQAGATDYLSKNEVTPTSLERTIRYAIERRRLLDLNLQQKELLTTILDVDPGGMAVFSGPDLRINFANQAFRTLFPNLNDAPLGMTARELFQGEEGLGKVFGVNESLQNKTPLDIRDFTVTYPGGPVRHYMIFLRPLFLQEEPALLIVLWETTDLEEARKQVQQAAEEAEQRAIELKLVLEQLESEQAKLNALIANAPSGIAVVDREGRIILTNPIADQIYAHSLQVGQPFQMLTHLNICHPGGAPYDSNDLPLTRSALFGETFENIEMLIIRSDGQQRSILLNSAPIQDHHGNLTGAVAVFVDITEHKRAELEIRKNLAHIEVQRRLMQASEKERLRIARDLHDGPLQGLIGMTFEINNLKNMGLNGPFTQGLAELGNMLQEQIREIRAFSQELRPSVLTPFGLEKAIRSHADTFQASHPELKIHLEMESDGQALSEEVRLALFRIYQELLNNIIRHAEATRVWVKLELSQDQVLLEVSDNGCGFEVPSNWVDMARQGHLGLVGVQERAVSINGIVEIFSQPDGGTNVRVIGPLT